MGIGIRSCGESFAIWSGDVLSIIDKNGKSLTNKEFSGGINGNFQEKNYLGFQYIDFQMCIFGKTKFWFLPRKSYIL